MTKNKAFTISKLILLSLCFLTLTYISGYAINELASRDYSVWFAFPTMMVLAFIWIGSFVGTFMPWWGIVDEFKGF